MLEVVTACITLATDRRSAMEEDEQRVWGRGRGCGGTRHVLLWLLGCGREGERERERSRELALVGCVVGTTNGTARSATMTSVGPWQHYCGLWQLNTIYEELPAFAGVWLPPTRYTSVPV